MEHYRSGLVKLVRKETLALRLHELDQQIKDQVSQLKSSIEGFLEEAFASIQHDLLSEMEQHKLA